jgi:hypothetical protein
MDVAFWVTCPFQLELAMTAPVVAPELKLSSVMV